MGCCCSGKRSTWTPEDEVIAAEKMKAGAAERCGGICARHKLKCYSRGFRGRALFALMMLNITIGPMWGSNSNTMGQFAKAVGQTITTCTTVSTAIVGTTICDQGTMSCLQVNVSYSTPSGVVNGYLMSDGKNIDSNQPCMVYKGSCVDGNTKIQEYTAQYSTAGQTFECSYTNANVNQVMSGSLLGYLIGGSFLIVVGCLQLTAMISLITSIFCIWGCRYCDSDPPQDVKDEAKQRYPNGFNREVDGVIWVTV